MRDGRVNDVNYQTDHPWMASKAIRELNKISIYQKWMLSHG